MKFYKPYSVEVVQEKVNKFFTFSNVSCSVENVYVVYDGTRILNIRNIMDAEFIVVALNGAYNEGRISTLHNPFEVN